MATAWLLRALLDDLATGHPQRVVGLAVALGVIGGVAALLPSATRDAESQLDQGDHPDQYRRTVRVGDRDARLAQP